MIVIYNQLPLYILLKVQIYGEREYLLLTLNRLLHWLNRLSGNHPHPNSKIRKSTEEGRRIIMGCSLVRSYFSKTFGFAIIPPGKGHYFIIPTQNGRWKKQGFLEHLLLPWSIYWSPKTSRVFILPTFPAFYRRTSISIPFCNCGWPFFKKGGPGLWTFSYHLVWNNIISSLNDEFRPSLLLNLAIANERRDSALKTFPWCNSTQHRPSLALYIRMAN